jgi:tRNA nucleotidyltransferase/poly(A) polymerase
MVDLHASIPTLLDRVLAILTQEDPPVYLVGGFVRDALLGRPGHDIDLIVRENAIGLTFRLANQLGLPAYRLDSERDVGRIVIPGTDITLDIAAFRGPDLATDLFNRDFTINAMAMPARIDATEEIIDLYQGQSDLKAGRIRMIHSKSMADDPIRAIRAVRFAVQLEAQITPETDMAARTVASELMARVSPERIRDELNRLLTMQVPDEGIRRLDELGLLNVILPEVAALAGINQSPPHHEPVLNHTLSTLRRLIEVEQWLVSPESFAANDWHSIAEPIIGSYREPLRDHLNQPIDGAVTIRQMLRWGALLHDTGKALTQTLDIGGRIRFLGHDEAGERLARHRLNTLSFSNQAIRLVAELVAGHMRLLYLASEKRQPSRRTVYRFYRAFPTAGLVIPLLAWADHLATYNGPGEEKAHQWLLKVIQTLYETYFTAYHEAVAPIRLLSGLELMQLLNIPPGPEIGRLIRILEEAQAAGEINSRDEAIEFVRQQSRVEK